MRRGPEGPGGGPHRLDGSAYDSRVASGRAANAFDRASRRVRSAGKFSDAGRAEMRTSPCELGVLEKADESSAEVAGDGDSSEAYGIVTGAVDMVVRTESRGA